MTPTDLTPGTRLTPLVMRMDPAVLVAYAGATWDWHRLHHDREYARQLGLPGPVVDGQIFGALIAEQCMTAFGPDAWVRNLGFRFKAMVYAGDEIEVTGEIATVVSSPEGSIVSVDHRVAVGERVAVAPAHSEVLVRG